MITSLIAGPSLALLATYRAVSSQSAGVVPSVLPSVTYPPLNPPQNPPSPVRSFAPPLPCTSLRSFPRFPSLYPHAFPVSAP